MQSKAEEPRAYDSALLTCVLEYAIVLLFGISLIVEYYHNVYQQEYFGSFNPVFLVLVLMASAGYGFTRLVSLVARHGIISNGAQRTDMEEDY